MAMGDTGQRAPQRPNGRTYRILATVPGRVRGDGAGSGRLPVRGARESGVTGLPRRARGGAA